MKKTTQSGVLLIVSGCLALCGWGATTLSFAPEGAAWTGGEGVRQFEDTDNWTRASSGTDDELLIQNKKVDLYLEDDVTLTKLKLRGGKGNKVIGLDLRDHTLNATSALRIWDQDVVISNGTFKSPLLKMGDSAVPSVHLVLSNVTCKLSATSQSLGYKSNSLTLYDTDFDYADSWNTGFALSSSNQTFAIHNSCVETNSARAGALIIGARDAKVLIDGEKSNVRLGWFLFDSGAQNALFSIRDGVSSVDHDSYSKLHFDSGATSNLVTVGKVKKPFFRTKLIFGAASVGNRIVVEKGGAAGCTHTPESTPMSGIGNRIEICDGCFTNSRTCYLATDLAADGNAIALKGDDATFVVGRDLVVGNKENAHAPMRFEFAPGEKGFNNAAPFRAIGGSNFTKAISNLVISVDATAFVGEKTGKFKLPLMKFGSTPNRLEVDELNAVLESEPAGGTLSYDTTDKTLYWNYRKPSGLMLIFR